MRGISITNATGLGDVVQFSSLPENYFKHTGQKLIDVSKSWIYDHNPYVIRDAVPHDVTELWTNWTKFNRPPVPLSYSSDLHGPKVFLSNAEHHCTHFKVPVVLNRPRLYAYEDFPIQKRTKILIHVDGRSNGMMPGYVIKHILSKYEGMDLHQIGGRNAPSIGIPRIFTSTPWELVQVVSEARMLIGLDSGPSWVAACYPDIIIKKLRMIPEVDYLKHWVPLEMDNIHAHWDDRIFQVFNPTQDDVGFTQSYRKI